MSGDSSGSLSTLTITARQHRRLTDLMRSLAFACMTRLSNSRTHRLYPTTPIAAPHLSHPHHCPPAHQSACVADAPAPHPCQIRLDRRPARLHIRIRSLPCDLSPSVRRHSPQLPLHSRWRNNLLHSSLRKCRHLQNRCLGRLLRSRIDQGQSCVMLAFISPCERVKLTEQPLLIPVPRQKSSTNHTPILRHPRC